MRIINRYILIFLASLFLYGCGGDSSSSSKVVDDPVTEEPIVEEPIDDEEESDSEETENGVVISPSRTECASPCTVVFSAEDTEFTDLDEHDVWRNVAYHWDFDTDESDTYGSLYDQSYTYVDGDTAYEVGFAPLVTKTFLCDSGTCVYNVGLRGQDENGNYGDAWVSITVNAESTEWSAADTICISNTLDTATEWTGYDKACPSSATKQSVFPDADEYDGKLILLKKGDIFSQNITQWSDQSNFKIGYFGDEDESKPELDGTLYMGAHGITGETNSPDFVWSYADDSTVGQYGWPENIYVEGIKVASVSFPMSAQQVGIHDIDLDRESEESGGSIGLSRGHLYCTDYPEKLDCDNVPFSKGIYISKVDIVGSKEAITNDLVLNVASIGCDMANYTGIVDSRFRRAGEHNLRVMGWWRLSLMRNQWLGQHYSAGKQKITTRPCLYSGVSTDDLPTAESPDLLIPDTWDDDPEGRTRADLFWDVDDEYVHVSRYQAVVGNVVGDPGPLLGSYYGSTKIQTNVTEGYQTLVRDIVYSNNTFYDESEGDTYDISAAGWYVTCRDNTYSSSSGQCLPTSPADGSNMLTNPDTFTYPELPGS